jgi:hypothetical protein
MFENPEEQDKIRTIFKGIYSKEKTLIPGFRSAVLNNAPIGLYVATKSQDDISWIFDTKQIELMLGGRDAYISIREQLLPTKKDEREYIMMIVFKKVGPIYSIRLKKSILEEVFLD